MAYRFCKDCGQVHHFNGELERFVKIAVRIDLVKALLTKYTVNGGSLRVEFEAYVKFALFVGALAMPRRRSRGMETRGQAMGINISRDEAGGSRFNTLANSPDEDDSPSDTDSQIGAASSDRATRKRKQTPDKNSGAHS
ncbi:hypothetical protein Nepgr_008961 [Nepenthes gracilis]|uniref:Uncharacterized protein n=1 Tax=Nepenthes gracilis TaxID=150966 RepID=A0AAD3S9Y5_NEPGR|nr:hypothetical protein Nepgr_008961 [Nepenthes gracilis]